MQNAPQLKTYKEMDEELELLVEQDKKHRYKKFGIFLIIVICVIFSSTLFNGRLMCKFLHAYPKVSTYTSIPINLYSEPIQNPVDTDLAKMTISADNAYAESSKNFLISGVEETYANNNPTNSGEGANFAEVINLLMSTNTPGSFQYLGVDGKSKAKIVPLATYSISGRMVALNYSFGPYTYLFDRLSTVDIGLVWGDLSSMTILKKYFRFKCEKLFNDTRQLHIMMKTRAGYPLAFKYTNRHVSHTHVIKTYTRHYSV